MLPACPTIHRSSITTVDITAERRIGRRERRGAKRGDRRQRRVVAVTGGAGYIGSVLVRRLLDRGHQVRVIERFLYGDGAIQDLLPHPNLSLTVADFRQPHGLDRALAGADAVAHLGGIAGDAACALDEDLALSTNVEATNLIANLCRALGVPRLVFASTCGVYGANDAVVDESSPLHPTSLYARSKLAAERLLLDHPDRRTAPVILRLADAYGVSYRPRYDLPVNALVAQAVTLGRTALGGDTVRPFVHVDDIARALVAVVEAPLDRVANQVFNVGADEPEGQVRALGARADEPEGQVQTLGAHLRMLLPQAEVQVDGEAGDRSYQRVCGEKLRAAVGFQPVRSMAEGVAELVTDVGGPLRRWRDPVYDNCAYLAHLIATQPAILAPADGGRLLRAVRAGAGRTPPRHLRVATLP